MIRRLMQALDPPPQQRSSGAEAWQRALLLVLTFRSAADRLWSPLHAIAFSPLLAEVLVLVLYALFLALCLPFRLIAMLLTSYGAAVVYAVGLFLLGRFIARIVAFPGSLSSVQRDISKDYMRRLCMQLAHLSNSILEWIELLQVKLTGANLGVDATVHSHYADLVFTNTQTLPTLFRWIGEARDKVHGELKDAEDEQVEQLRSAVQALVAALTSALPEIGEFLTNNAGRHLNQLQRVHTCLATLTTACEGLQTCVASIRPDAQATMGLRGIIEAIKTFGSGPRGIEKLAFHMMRLQITELYGGEAVAIRGPDGNVIDGCYIPCTQIRRHLMAQRNSTTPNTTTDPTAAQRLPKSIGTVLFCNPNAGFWECSGQGSATSTWLGYYTDAGFDVFLFNYRGYNASEGLPNPMRLKADGEAILDYLRTERRVERVVIHGESIGGMVACHIASTATPPPALLVADRTFASLEATAARLLGTWAYFAVQWLTMWVTDVVADFLSVDCPKIVLCDPNDEVIANGASLKTGLAARVVFGDQTGGVKQLPQRYVIAQALEQLPPHDSAEALLAEANNLEAPLSEAFVEHLCACIIHIARDARHIEHHFCEAVDEEGLELRSMEDSGSETPSEGETEPTQQHAQAHTADCCGGDHAHEDSASGGNIVLASRDRVLRSRLERLCSQSADDPRLKPMEKAWLALARINGNCGVLLAQSLNRSLESFRGWLCELIVWSGSTRPDEAMPSGAVEFSQGLSDLRRVVSANDELALNEAVKFTLAAFECISKRMENGISSASSALRISRKRLGTLIPLHCGHNGALSAYDKTVFSELLLEAGFPICSSILVAQHDLKLPVVDGEQKSHS